MQRRIGQSMLAPPPQRSGPWASRVIDTLADLKAAGIDFETAWEFAVAQHPPRGRDLGDRRPALLDDDGAGGFSAASELSPVEFLRRSCEDAWHNRRPILNHLVVPDRERVGGGWQGTVAKPSRQVA